MFFHVKEMQYEAKPERSDPVYAKKLQEVLGGQWGEMSVMMAYLFQGWNCRGPTKYRDLLLDIGTEEMAHVEMLATLIARLLEGASDEDQRAAAGANPAVGAALGGTDATAALLAAGPNPQHLIVSGQGATPTDSVGFPWTSRYIIASGNLLADFRFNLAAESQGRLQATRLYNLTDDAGVRNTLAFLIARDAYHQNLWLAAIEELESDGLDRTPAPAAFPTELQHDEFAHRYFSFSLGDEAGEGRWASGPKPDGSGDVEYVAEPGAHGGAPRLRPGDPGLYGTPETPPDGRT